MICDYDNGKSHWRYGVRPKSRRIADFRRPFLDQAHHREIMLSFPQSHSSGLARIDAQWDFRHARRAYLVGRLGGWVRCAGPAGAPKRSRRRPPWPPGPAGSRPCPSAASSARSNRLTASTRSFVPHWRSCGGAGSGSRSRTDQAIPRRQSSCAVNQTAIIVDGRHRVSVARTLRHRDIDAWATGPEAERDGPNTFRRNRRHCCAIARS